MDAYAKLSLIAAGLSLTKVLVPGPSMILLLQCTMARGRRSGTLMALGMATADGIFAALLLTGMGWIVGAPGVARQVLQIGGVVLLFAFGVSMVDAGLGRAARSWPRLADREDGRHDAARSGASEAVPPAMPPAVSLPRPLRCFGLGLCSGLGNPTTVGFLVGLQALLAGAADTSGTRGAVITTFVATSLAARGALPLLFSCRGVRIGYLRGERWLNCAGGALMIAFAVSTAWTTLA